MKLVDLIPLKETSNLRKSLMGIGKYDSDAETEFNRHHGGSMYGDHMGNIADKDTIDFDDEEKDRASGTIEPYEPKKDKINRGYEPVNLQKIKEMKLTDLIPLSSNFTIAKVLTKEEANKAWEEIQLEMENPCWKGYEMVGTKTKDGKEVPNCVPVKENDQPGGYYGDENVDEDIDNDDDVNYGTVEPEEYDVDNYDDYEDFIKFMRSYSAELNEATCPCMHEAEYQGREVKLGKPMQGDVKKFKVYVKNSKGNVVKVNFGDPNMRIKKSNPARRKSFRARHHCENPGPRDKARYWSCRKW